MHIRTKGYFAIDGGEFFLTFSLFKSFLPIHITKGKSKVLQN